MNERSAAGACRPYLWAMLVFGFIALTSAVSLYALRTPTPLPIDAPITEFSARRAIAHDFIIANEPHPAGSIANEKTPVYIRDTLLAFGVNAEVVSDYTAAGHSAGRRDMVLGRIPGTDNTKAFALMAHYDSVPYGPGGSDDCSGVISMLEIARTLKASPPLKNDVIFVFTDGEEGNKLGSRAFAAHPWFHEVGVMTDLESRGTTGNSIMFGTSDQNGWLINHLIQAARYPCATSLGYDIYKRMPFSTDFDELRPRGMKGFDIAFVDNFAWYHTMNDTPEHLDLGTLQQHGMFALDLARHFGDLPLDGELTAPDAMYFNTLGYRMAHYPLSWGAPFAIGAALLVLVTLVAGRVRGHLTFAGILAGVLVWAIAALLAAVTCAVLLAVVWGADTVATLYTKDFTRIPNLYPLYHNKLYATSFATATVGVMVIVYGAVSRWMRPQSLVTGVYLWWTAGALALAHYLPGGSYLLMWPLAFAAVGALLAFVLCKPGCLHPVWILVLAVFTAPAIVLFTPAYFTFASTVMIMGGPALAILLALPLGLLAPQIGLMARVNRWWLPLLSALITTGLIGYGLANSSFTPERPKLDSLSYGIDYDTNRAYWLSPDPNPDEWTAQFFPPDTPRAEYSEFGGRRGDNVLKAPAPIAPEYPGPQITVTSDKTVDGVRELVIHVTSPAKAAHLDIRMLSDTEVLGASVFGKPLAADKARWFVSFRLFPCEGVDLTLRTPTGQPVRINARELFYGLPALPGYQPRPNYIICTPNTVDHHGRGLESNRIWVTKTFDL